MRDLAHTSRVNKATNMLSTFSIPRTMDCVLPIAADLPPLHMLVVDEDEASRSACIEIAESLGYRAEGVAKLGRVRSSLLQFPTDIVLIDLPRNGESGLETVAE